MKKKNRLILFISIASVLFFSGCVSTINTNAFTKFDYAMQEAQTGIDNAMKINYEWVRSGYIDKLSISDESTSDKINFSDLIVTVEAGYGWSMKKKPLFLTIKNIQLGLYELNESFSKYAKLLSNLSSGSLVNKNTFNQLADDLNANISKVSKSLNLGGSSKGLKIFSKGASELARLYIEKKRQKYLIKIIKNNQANIKSYSDACISLIQTNRSAIKSYYERRYEPIQALWMKATDDEDINIRKNLAESMLSLNEEFTTVLSILKELENTFSALPDAHNNLSKAIGKSGFNLKEIQKLYSSGKKLQKLYNGLNVAQKMRENFREDLNIRERVKDRLKDSTKERLKDRFKDNAKEKLEDKLNSNL